MERDNEKALKNQGNKLVTIEVANGKQGTSQAPNYIRTSKFTKANFIPKGLFEQFIRPIFIYFIVLISSDSNSLSFGFRLLFPRSKCLVGSFSCFLIARQPWSWIDLGNHRCSTVFRQLRYLALLSFGSFSCRQRYDGQGVLRRQKKTNRGQNGELKALWCPDNDQQQHQLFIEKRTKQSLESIQIPKLWGAD